MLIFILTIFCKQYTRSLHSKLATISFDEGPSKHTETVLQKLKDANVQATFHLDPNRIKDISIVDQILNQGHTLGLSINIDVTEHKNFDQYIKDMLSEFKKKTGIVPKFVRLPRAYYTHEHIKIAEDNDLIVTKPNLDSEDTDRVDFYEQFEWFVMNRRKSSLSILLHDRMGAMVEKLDLILKMVMKRYKVVNLAEFYGIDAKMVKAAKEADITSTSSTSNNSNSNSSSHFSSSHFNGTSSVDSNKANNSVPGLIRSKQTENFDENTSNNKGEISNSDKHKREPVKTIVVSSKRSSLDDFNAAFNRDDDVKKADLEKDTKKDSSDNKDKLKDAKKNKKSKKNKSGGKADDEKSDSNKKEDYEDEDEDEDEKMKDKSGVNSKRKTSGQDSCAVSMCFNCVILLITLFILN